MALIDVVFYNGDDLVYKWSPNGNSENYQLKLGSQLVVRETQTAVFFKEGKLLDIFGPGTHTIHSNNIPILSKLINLPFGSTSPFFAEVYYVNNTVLFDSKFGIHSFNLIEPQFKIPVSVSSRGSYALKVADPIKLLTLLAGTSKVVNKEMLRDYFRGIINQAVKNSIVEISKRDSISPLALEMICDEVSTSVRPIVENVLIEYGLELKMFNIEGIPIDDSDPKVMAIVQDYQRIMSEDIEERMRLKRRAENIDVFKVERSFDTSEKLADNLGSTEGGNGVMGAMIGLGVATPIANNLGNAIGQNFSNAQPPELSDNSAVYFYSVDGKNKIGPVPFDVLVQMFQSNIVTRETKVWKTGLPSWINLSQLPESSSFLSNEPPALEP
ncbi:MAG: SPFH domain-containing protein [Flavobacteriales bacterium]